MQIYEIIIKKSSKICKIQKKLSTDTRLVQDYYKTGTSLVQDWGCFGCSLGGYLGMMNVKCWMLNDKDTIFNRRGTQSFSQSNAKNSLVIKTLFLISNLRVEKGIHHHRSFAGWDGLWVGWNAWMLYDMI